MSADWSARTQSESYVNSLVRLLEPRDLRLLARHLMPVRFALGEVVVSPDTPLKRVVFPQTAIIAMRDGRAGERTHIGMVGLEGMVGWPLLLGSEHSPMVGVAQVQGGTALAIDADKLREACDVSASLKLALLRFVHNFMTQMACTIATNASDTIERRVARWLLMLHDRSHDDAISLTHDNVSNALNVRRASVTDCLHILEGEGLMRCTRGRIVIRDRAGLKRLAGESYGVPETQYAREIGQFVKAD